MSSKFADTTATYSVVDVTKKKTRLAAKKDKPPEILSDIPMYSEINQVSEASAPRNADTAFDNQVYSMDTSDNTYSLLNRTVEQSSQENPATPRDNMLWTKTAPHKEKSKKDQCERNLVWIVISVNILLLFIVGVLAVAALVQVSKLKDKTVPIKESISCSNRVSVLEGKTESLLQNFTQLVETTQNRIINETMTSNQQYLELENKLAGLHSSFLAVSCATILQFAPFSPSGHYWIRSSNGSAVHVYCDMTRSCGGVTGGWMRVASLDMRDNSNQCPSGLRQGDSCTSEPTCEIGTNSETGKCSSNSYTSHGLHYSHVCGMIRAYQYRTPDGFRNRGNREMPLDIDSNYVDGVSLTHGMPHSRKHIWTFAADHSGTS